MNWRSDLGVDVLKARAELCTCIINATVASRLLAKICFLFGGEEEVEGEARELRSRLVVLALAGVLDRSEVGWVAFGGVYCLSCRGLALFCSERASLYGCWPMFHCRDSGLLIRVGLPFCISSSLFAGVGLFVSLACDALTFGGCDPLPLFMAFETATTSGLTAMSWTPGVLATVC